MFFAYFRPCWRTFQYPDEFSCLWISLSSHLLSDPQKPAYLKRELAAVVDVGEYLVKATYELESDGPLCLTCFEVISVLTAAIQTSHFPNLEAIARMLATGSPNLVQKWIDYGKVCVKPGLDYFSTKFQHDLCDTVAAFKVARLLLPTKMAEMSPSAGVVDELKAFPFLDNRILLDNLKLELPKYLAKVADASPNIDPLIWWKNYSYCSDLPHWSAAVKDAILVQLSASAAERTFSFGPQQDKSLQDYVESAVMLQYNKH